jgi:hypothetical protein
MYSNNNQKGENQKNEESYNNSENDEKMKNTEKMDSVKSVVEKTNENLRPVDRLSIEKSVNAESQGSKTEETGVFPNKVEEPKKRVAEENVLQKQVIEQTKDAVKKHVNASVDSNGTKKSSTKESIKKNDNEKFHLSDKDRERLIKKIKVLNKDLNLKLLAKVLYNKKNYYCELECKIFDDSYYKFYKKEEISDIDVFGIKFEEDLTCIKVGFECKSTEREGVDEILKLKGTQEYVGLNFAGLLKKRVANNVRLVANKLKIEVYDENEIERKVESLVFNYKDKIQEETTLYCLKMSIENEIKEKSKGIIFYMKSDYWTNEPYQNINTLVRGIEHISQIKEFHTYQKRYILLKLSALISITFLEIISFIVRTNYSQVNEVALDQLFGGAAMRREKERTFDLISQEIGKKLHPYPYFTEDYLNIIHWFIRELEAASMVPLCIEEIQKCFLMGIDLKSIRNKYSDFTIKLSKDILRFTSKIYKDKSILDFVYEL